MWLEAVFSRFLTTEMSTPTRVCQRRCRATKTTAIGLVALAISLRAPLREYRSTFPPTSRWARRKWQPKSDWSTRLDSKSRVPTRVWNRTHGGIKWCCAWRAANWRTRPAKGAAIFCPPIPSAQFNCPFGWKAQRDVELQVILL